MIFKKKTKTTLFLNIFVCVCMLVFSSSCSKKILTNRPEYQFKSIDGLPDYSNLNYWGAHPWKWDPSDSVPKSLRSNYSKDSLADVFFIYPTTLVGALDFRTNAPIDDQIINSKTDYSALLYQASAFNEKCRVFSPRYRQANLKEFFTQDTTKSNRAFSLAYQDIRNAFSYYLKNWNNGRSIIIAAHSQGTVHAAKLLKEFFEGQPLQNKLVCAYLIGMPVAETYFDKIPVCKDSAATGCYVSWRTFKSGYIEPNYIAKEKFRCIVTNPLTWSSDNKTAPKVLNKGGILKNFNKLIPGVVNAQVHNNVLWTCKPKFFGNIFLVSKNYHIGDINLFYNNMRQNVVTRINAFKKK